MGQITKEFAETLLKRVQSGKHINTTVGEEEQLLKAWLYWHENVYVPRLNAFIADHPVTDGGEAGMSGGSFAAKSPQSQESK